ncbi:MAG: Rieske (2Fe-2S) protein [Burkholderiaceae bacterium]
MTRRRSRRVGRALWWSPYQTSPDGLQALARSILACSVPDPGLPVPAWQRLCSLDELKAMQARGDALRFELDGPKGPLPAFLMLVEGRARAWLNRCAHVPVELDGVPGRFLDESGQVIVCATHGAVYDPASGRCLRGPCRGKSLHPVPIREEGGWIEAARDLSSSS